MFNPQATTDTLARRDFLRTAATAAAAFTVVRPQAVRGTDANSKIEMGLVGAGNRGIWLGDLAHQHTGIRVTALADVFDSRLKAGREKLGVNEQKCFRGLDAYKAMIANGGIDAVAIESPAYFHPEQTKAAVDAGKHVFLAKPVAIDVPGCQTIIECGRKAAGKTSFLVDFQTRANKFYIEAARRVHAGEIGTPVCGQVTYHAPRLGFDGMPDGKSDAWRIRNWFFDKQLSGDVIVEQNVHVLDVANWFLKGHPTRAFGTGGRKCRVDVGDTWDHFVATFWYPGDLVVDFGSTQFLKGFNATRISDLVTRIFGTKGTVDTRYGGDVGIWTPKKETNWPGGNTQDIYVSGAVNNLKAFDRSIREGDNKTNNAEESAVSSLTTILGRMACYRQAVVTWDEMIKANEKIEVHLTISDDEAAT